MSITLYELLGRDDRRFSPYCWRIRLALAHMGLTPDEIVPVGFTEKEKIAFSGGTTIPVLVDGDTTVRDSWDIAEYLMQAYPERTALWHGSEGRNFARFVNLWTDQAMLPAIFRVIVADVYAHARDEDQPYFRESREKRLGKTLEEAAAEREGHAAALDRTLAPLRSLVSEQDYVCGAAPAYADFIAFGSLQWARCASPYALLAPDDPIHAWRGRMLDLFDGYAGKEAAA